MHARRSSLLTLLVCLSVTTVAQPPAWQMASRLTTPDFLCSAEALAIADSIVKYQLPNGGWLKNQDWTQGVNRQDWEKAQRTGVGATIDNGATYTEMRYLARVLSVQPTLTEQRRETYASSFCAGLSYLLRMQYPNGGFPQFFPYEGAAPYSRHITLNDDAMVGVLRLLRDVSQQRAPYDAVPLTDLLLTAAKDALQRGIQCLLNCQIRKDGRLTVWCQQHHFETLQPVGARSYELPSFSGNGETPNILLFLMDIESPSVDVCQAVEAGMAWLWAHRIEGFVLEHFTNADGQPDQRLVPSADAPPLLARYYDLATEQPYYCDRDGIPHPHLSDIGYERRNGYAWIRPFPQHLIHTYERWKAQTAETSRNK
ncbi:MAG: pectate lyase [Bacteroidaceae bacterium]|nr:pectate lyase [Bacteroidaceae bacterium]